MAIARALIAEPAVTFADEPTGALDTHVAAEVLELLRESVHEAGQTVVMVTHDPVAAAYAERVVFLADGRLVDELIAPTAERVAERLTELAELVRAMRRLKHRRAALFATLVAVALGAALASACGGLFETALRLDAPPQRLAAADVVVAARRARARWRPATASRAQPVTLSERGRAAARALLEAVAAVDGRRRAPCLGASLRRDRGRPPPRRRAGARSRSRLGDRRARAAPSVLTGDDRGRAEATGVAASRLEADPAVEHLRRAWR